MNIMEKVKVLFCGTGHFASAFKLTKSILDSETIPFDVVECSRDFVGTEICNATVVVPLMTQITGQMINDAQKLKMIMQFGVGLEGVDIESCTNRNIAVCNIPSENTGNAESCAEMCIFLYLSLLRNITAMSRSISDGRLGFPTGKTIFKSNVIIFGFGGMGKKLLQRLLPFDLSNITIVVRDLSKIVLIENNYGINIEFVSIYNYRCHLPAADAIFLCCSQNASNFGMVNNEFLANLKSDSFIINVARVYSKLLSNSILYNGFTYREG